MHLNPKIEIFLIQNLNCDLCCHRDDGSGRGQGRGSGQGQDQERDPKVGKLFHFRVEMHQFS